MKIWSLPNYPRKLTALLFMCTKRLVQFVPYNVTVSSTVPGAGGGGTIIAYTEELFPRERKGREGFL